MVSGNEYEYIYIYNYVGLSVGMSVLGQNV